MNTYPVVWQIEDPSKNALAALALDAMMETDAFKSVMFREAGWISNGGIWVAPTNASAVVAVPVKPVELPASTTGGAQISCYTYGLPWLMALMTLSAVYTTTGYVSGTPFGGSEDNAVLFLARQRQSLVHNAAKIAADIQGRELDEGEQTLAYDELIGELPAVKAFIDAYRLGCSIMINLG